MGCRDRDFRIMQWNCTSLMIVLFVYECTLRFWVVLLLCGTKPLTAWQCECARSLNRRLIWPTQLFRMPVRELPNYGTHFKMISTHFVQLHWASRAVSQRCNSVWFFSSSIDNSFSPVGRRCILGHFLRLTHMTAQFHSTWKVSR